MKYIAFKGTYNEQIYDTTTKTITLTRGGYSIEDCRPVFVRGRWQKIKEAK